MSERILYEFDVSPYCRKARAILNYKGIDYRRVEIDALSREQPRRLSGQSKVPVLDDGGHVVADSTAIALYLEEAYPEPALLPHAPARRQLSRLLATWADETLARWVIQHKFLVVSTNVERVVAETVGRSDTLTSRLVRPLAPAVFRSRTRRRYPGFEREEVVRRLDEQLDLLDGALRHQAYLLGDGTPTLADMSVFGMFWAYEGFDGFEIVEQRPALHEWYRRMHDGCAAGG